MQQRQPPEPSAVDPEREFAAALAEAATFVNSALSVDEVLDRILEQVARVVPGDMYNIVLIDGDEGRIVRWRGYDVLGIADEDMAHKPTPVFSYTTFRTMIETGEPIVIHDTVTSETWVQRSDRSEHRAYVGAPVRIDGKTEGFLNVNSIHAQRYSQRDGLRLRAFADHAAIALRNARLFEAKSRYADELETRVRERTRELQARTAWLEAILQGTTDGIIVATRQGDIIQTNPVAARWLQEGAAGPQKNPLREAVRSLARQTGDRTETFIELAGHDLELRAAPVSPTDREAPVVITVHDVSHLRALDRMRSRFISDVSHELRTPIAAIRLYASLLRESQAERRETYFSSLDEEIGRLSRLVEGILQIARIEAGRLEIEPQRVDLNVLASSAAAGYADAAAARGITLACQLADQPITVSGDPHWFVQVIDNIVENAILYTPAGHIQISVGSARDDTQNWAVLSVEDTGIGVPPDELPRIFERFYRGEEARTLQLPGNGLGLTIAKAIVDLHNGTLEVESQVGVGSRFTVRLPLASPTI